MMQFVGGLTAEPERDLAVDEQPREGGEAAERDGDVREHDEVGHEDGVHVRLGLAVQLVLDGALRRVRDVHVARHRLLRVVLHERNERLLPLQCLFQLWTNKVSSTNVGPAVPFATRQRFNASCIVVCYFIFLCIEKTLSSLWS